MSLVLVTRTRENMTWQTITIASDLDLEAIRAECDGWQVRVEPYEPDDAL